MNNQAIGILDSGVGGLTIWKEIVSQLPYEPTIYIGDSKNCPYGNRSAEEIYQLARRLVEFLIQKQCKLIVVACNTITVSCLEKLRQEFRAIPIVGTVPVVKTASEMSRSKRIAIFSTSATEKSQYQRDLINRFARECEVITVGTDKLVPLIEQGKLKGEEVQKVLREELQEIVNGHIDVLALGCSHFPLVRKEIQKIVGERVKVLDSAGAIARQVERVLRNRMSLFDQKQSIHEFYTTGDSQLFSKILKIIGYNNSVHTIDL